ncbi:extracellular solute-binding protein [Anaerocolumna cellulosilytica]|nr:extracellular solute-binding protein [Anaerocolumna cellulosilytica]MBB5197208.1 ABC-type glycerol-3-phosphate transport system substrate-binding protein [Anaerocolumna cellulosilytica]
MRKKIIGIVLLTAIIVMVLRIGSHDTEGYFFKYADAVNLETDVEGIGRENTYSKYLLEHAGEILPRKEIDLDLRAGGKLSGTEILEEYEGEEAVLLTLEESFVEWQISVSEGGMYQIYIEYYPVKARGVDIERKLYINGELPFLGAEALNLTRLWTNGTEIITDNQGNDIRPTQVDVSLWTGVYLKDDMGYYTRPYSFYFKKGINTIGLEGVNEPMVIKSITLQPVAENNNYTEYRKEMEQLSLTDTVLNYKQVIQGEASTLRSSPSLYPIYDRSSSNTQPASVSKIKLNMIGGNAWRVPGQWIEWEFQVPEDGYYHITIKGRQNYKRGFVSTRILYLDNQIPFSEMEQVSFRYSNTWENMSLSDVDNQPYEFYLKKGIHTLRLEVTLGDLGDILNRMQDSVYRLNEIYRKILVLTGTTPDKYRDYKIDTIYPEVIEGMELESKRLYKIVDDIVAYTGQKESQAAIIQTLAEQLERFVEDPFKIARTFTNFKDNISALGTAVLNLSEAPLDIDYITITGLKAEVDSVKENFADKILHEIKSFAASFTEDYNAVGDVYEKEEAVEVWILTGRDQSSILKSMIDDSFTPNTGIKINVKLVEAGTVLNAVIAGTGPDVVLSAGQGEPVNYALRNAVEDLTQFDGYEEVLNDYYPSAYTPFYFEEGIYALPETQNFNVMFYRKDIFKELGIELPNTWDELINILPTIQQNNMNVAVPTTERVINNVSSPDLSSFFALLYQNGGTVYDASGKRTLIDEESGVKAFETYTHLFTQYSVPTIYDFVNRFRSGEMPLGIQDYSVFNTLVVFAPEIRGVWDFTLIPGTLKEDGTIDRSCHSSGTCSMLLKQEDEAMKEKAWEFLKWWSSADTQIRFGQEMESVMGASARYATANTKAFQQLSWSSTQREVLEEQWRFTVGLREVAGGYYTGRHITNAIRNVLNKKEDPRETLLDYARTIDEEIVKKRLEFGLDLR